MLQFWTLCGKLPLNVQFSVNPTLNPCGCFPSKHVWPNLLDEARHRDRKWSLSKCFLVQQMTTSREAFLLFLDIARLVLLVSSYYCRHDLPENVGKPLTKNTQSPLLVAVHHSKIPLPISSQIMISRSWKECGGVNLCNNFLLQCSAC